MQKRITLLLLASLLLLLTACGNTNNAVDKPSSTDKKNNTSNNESAAKDPHGKYDEPITLKIAKNYGTKDLKLPNGDTLENNEYYRYLEKKLNVKISFAWQTETADAYQQKIGVAIASQDLPDAFIVNEQQLKQLVKADLVADLTDVYKNYVGELIKGYYDSYGDRVLSRATFDGKLYAFPNTEIGGQHSFTWIRQDWLDKVGMQMPTTVDELEAVAKAFIEKDPDGNGKADTIGFTGLPQLSAWNSSNTLDPIFGAYKAFKGLFINDASGEVAYSSTLPEMKTALAKLQELYKKDILDKEFAVRKDPNELIAGNKVGIMFGPWWMPYSPLPDSVKNDMKAEWKPLTGPLDSEGKFNISDQDPTTSFLVVNKKYEHPEAVLKVLNTQTEGIRFLDPGSADIYKGLGIDWGIWPFALQLSNESAAYDVYVELKKAIDDKDPSKLNDEVKGFYNDYMKNKENPKKDLVAWSSAVARVDGTAEIGSDKLNIVRNVFFGKTATMQRKWAILTKLENETFLKIILGDEPIEKFDDFVKEWNKLGGDEVLKEIKAEIEK
ncbi:extracellular solute-binding protein [Paenibacillus nasutitermitis]|uniref:Sugar ABC transporter substrate-binding protein n=1 Tax=Paenibacillus nasutitermitis TaxID=1652958 RepID=A0A917DQB7_9BACL|nr:extracellular solute-binding protein [Paenibacillus nasutitermitis]GGD58983.1 sugar ABC transporter substrate-binding protein [Paenibacillus nasutitermitis]